MKLKLKKMVQTSILRIKHNVLLLDEKGTQNALKLAAGSKKF